jgi:hypothetical protein
MSPQVHIKFGSVKTVLLLLSGALVGGMSALVDNVGSTRGHSCFAVSDGWKIAISANIKEAVDFSIPFCLSLCHTGIKSFPM